MDTKLQSLKGRFTIFAVAQMLGLNVPRDTGSVAIKCFAHEDKHPSFILYSENNNFECKSCSLKGDIFELIQKVKGITFKESVLFLDPNYYDKDTSAPRQEVGSAPTYLVSRGITKETQEKFKLKVDSKKITIPVPTGEKYRYFKGDIRYGAKTGTSGCVFKTSDRSDKVILVEGELDAILLHQETNYAVWTGTAGAATFKKEWADEFKEVSKIFICYDNDEPGQTGANLAASILGKERCYLVSIPKESGKDVTEFFQSGKTKEDFNNLLSSAKSFKTSLLSRYREQEQEGGYVVNTGFEILDKHTGGLRSRNSYLIAGLEKSGKSALLLTMVNNMLCNNEKVGYIDTELGLSDLSQRLTCIYHDITSQELQKEWQDEWVSMFQDNFFYAGIDSEDELKTNGILSFEKTRGKVAEFAGMGARVVIVDNLTVFSSLTEGNKKGWEALSKSMTTLINDAKEKNIILLFVVHTNESVVFTETPQGITHILESGKPQEIFKKSVTVTKRPRLADVFGGGAAHSQVSGAMLLWRPFQKFEDSTHSMLSCLILDSFRHAEPKDIKMTFHGSFGTFTEDDESLDYLRK